MKNLAGNKTCNKQIRKELEEAGVPIVSDRDCLKHEVPASIAGALGEFNFTRAWYYWVVSGDVPLRVAEDLYRGPIGKRDIRVVGHCGCPPPSEWAFPKKEVLYELGVYKHPSEEHPFGESPNYGDLAKMCNSGQIVAPRFVSSYHIDSQEGLNKFVKTIKAYGLVTV